MMLTDLPGDVICKYVFPSLSLRALQSLDTAYTNKDLRPHLRRLWRSYKYDCVDNLLCLQNIAWLHRVGVQIIGLSMSWRRRVEEDMIIRLLYPTPTLKALTIEDVIVTKNMMGLIAQNCPQLEVLRVGCACYDDSLSSVARHCHQLRTISLKTGRTTLATIQALCKNCPHMRHIHMNKFTTTSLISIADTYPHLQSITVRGDCIDDAGLLALAEKCHELKSVNIRFCSYVTNCGLVSIWEANPHLTDIALEDIEFISDEDIMVLLQCCSKLQKLNFKHCKKITDAAVIAVSEHCPRLKLLNIDGCYFVSDDALISLGQHCHGLKSINISYIDDISDAGISALATGCPLLQEFSAVGTNITDAGVIVLARSCRDLCKIDFSSCDSIGSDAISALAENCPLISVLDLSYCKSVDDACLYLIAQHCHNLSRLQIRMNNLSDHEAVKTISLSCRELIYVDFTVRNQNFVYEALFDDV